MFYATLLLVSCYSLRSLKKFPFTILGVPFIVLVKNLKGEVYTSLKDQSMKLIWMFIL